ncbi:LOB domain-containing protein 38-like [Andrographis paniculata]|uniref:LOB domain-containing protein 38-like n=1 Tax=Andrographis paniculata TaxID=175694 RepID=UPI0021E7F4A8|nr:LOB domain-containing protein 38-like [Andrographis paniculata]
MSCNGCRILRKGCNDNCILRQSIQGIDPPQAQAYATVFVAKFFGRAGLISFLSSVPESQRPALFQSLLFEACGRTVNPVSGSVGLLWTGNWHVCQSAVETVLRGGVLRASPEFEEASGDNYNSNELYRSSDLNSGIKRKAGFDQTDLEVSGVVDPRPAPAARMSCRGRAHERQATPSDESETTTFESGLLLYPPLHNQAFDQNNGTQTKLLHLFF